LTNCEKCTWNEDFAYLRLVLLSTTNRKIARGSNGTTSALGQRQKSHPSSELFSPILSLNPKPEAIEHEHMQTKTISIYDVQKK
jgi:hypothetical protein